MATSFAMTNTAVRQRHFNQHHFNQLRKQLKQTRAEMCRRVRDRDRQIAELSQKVSELNRRIVEFDQRFDDISTEVTRVRAADDLRIKQKCINATDASSSSSSGEISLPKQNNVICGPETCTERKSSLMVGSGQSQSVSCTSINSRKRKGLLEDRQTKRKKTDNASAVSDVRCLCLRSGRNVLCK